MRCICSGMGAMSFNFWVLRIVEYGEKDLPVNMAQLVANSSQNPNKSNSTDPLGFTPPPPKKPFPYLLCHHCKIPISFSTLSMSLSFHEYKHITS